MPDLAPLLPGQMVLLKGRVTATGGDRVWIEFSTGFTAAVEEADLVEVLDEQAPETYPLQVNDVVRDSQGVEWTVVAPEMNVEGQKGQVGLWNEQRGGVWDFPDNLAVVSRNGDTA